MTDPDLVRRLRENRIFGDLPEPVLDALASRAHRVTLDPGEVVFLEGDRISGLHVINEGRLKVVKVSAEGREQVLRYLGPGETFNEMGVFADRPNPASAIALEPTSIWLLPREQILALFENQSGFARHVVQVMAERVVELVELVANLSLRTVPGRLARLILDDARDGVVHRPRWYTQHELASRLGTVPDVVQRALRGFEQADLIALDRHEIRILDRDRLELLAQ